MSSNPAQLMEIAVAHHRAGRLAEAEAGYRQVLAADPDQPDALHLLGLIAIQMGKPRIAIELIERAIVRRPGFASALSNLGFAYQSAGRWPDAVAAYRRALECQPDLVEARVNLGNALVESGQAAEAIEVISRAIELKPEDANAHNSLGTAYRAVRRFDEAAAAFRHTLSINPDHAEAQNNLGNALRDLERQEEAIGHFERAIILRPDYGQSYSNLGGAYEELGQYVRAIATYRRAIEVSPQFPMAHVNLGIALLRTGDFEHGWAEYDYRYRDPEVAPLLGQSDRPIWDGSDLNGRTILLQSEQGIGDTIHFVRYLPMVAQRGGRVILRCLPPLMRLLETAPGADERVAIGDPIPAHDLQCPLLSLPRLFKTDPAGIPSTVPYLRADLDRASGWAQRLESVGGRFKVGVCWAGGARYINDRRRSIAPQLLTALGDVPDVRFVSLQKGRDEIGNLKFEISDWTADLHDFADTAALIEELDLVISVDTAVAHLAGAMGKAVWILLPFMPDWRWMLDRDDSPWYPTVRLFRQSTRGDWRGVIDRVAAALRQRAG